jgi:hypothetical protein
MTEQSGAPAHDPYDAVVTKDYSAQYTDPITLAKDEAAMLDGRAEPWEDHADWIWVWGENAAGKSGWMPRPLLRIEGSQGVALEDYDAHELTVAAGERVNAQREACGWAWCVADGGRSGWVPLSHLRRAS